jgi:alkylation response protein AidB-like acyl-CoA dehydrogenase
MIIEQGELRDSARRLISRVAKESKDEAWRAIVEAGWPALTAPASLGGLEQKLEAACWLYLELGRALSSAPLLPSLLAIEALAACEPSATRDAWIEQIAGGERIAVSLLDPMTVNPAGGAVGAVLGADRATHALVVSAADPMVALVALDGTKARVALRPTWDTTRALFEMYLSCPVSDHCLVLAHGPAATASCTALSRHLHFAIAADCVGAASVLLEQTVEHLKTRRQFDRPLASFQALKHRCADLKVTIQAAEALLADYLLRVDDRQPGEQLALAKAAKSIASSAFRDVAEESMQLHGGMSMSAEHTCHLFLKRALLNEQLGSPNDECDLASASVSTSAKTDCAIPWKATASS